MLPALTHCVLMKQKPCVSATDVRIDACPTLTVVKLVHGLAPCAVPLSYPSNHVGESYMAVCSAASLRAASCLKQTLYTHPDVPRKVRYYYLLIEKFFNTTNS